MTVGALRPLRAALLGAVAGLSAPTAHAAIMAPCAEPVLFPGADINLIVIPYALGGPDENYKLRPDIDALARSDASGKLANLIQLDTLYSLRYPVGMAVVHLMPSGEPCGPDDVRQDLEAQLADGKGLILLWGNFLEEEGHVYVQSYLELFRKERGDLVEITVDVLGGEIQLTGGSSQRALGFAPRILTEDDLARIGEAGDRARLIWSDPVGGHVVDELPASVEAPYAYYVTEVAPASGRMRIRPHEMLGGGDGWVEASRDWPLREMLPELYFVDGIMGYLAARIIAEERPEGAWGGRIMPGDGAAEPWMRRLADARERSQEAFARFRERAAEGGAEGDLDQRASAALSLLYAGMLDLLALGDGLEGLESEAALLERAARAFAAASELLPYRSDALTLEGVARAGLAAIDPDQVARAIEAWRAALSLDPGDRIAAANLAAVYRLLIETGSAALGGIAPDEIRARLAVLERQDKP